MSATLITLPSKLLQFPRTTDLPSQSPLFWVQQKDRYLRQLLLADIESITGRKMLVYFSNRFLPNSEIDASDVANVAELLSDAFEMNVDLVLETNGGVTDATESLISLIQSSVRDLRVIVANAAKSNGTLLALAASTIVMGATSELGPIEPSLAGVPCSILDTEEIAKTNFPLHKLGQYALAQSRSLAQTLLTKGMMRGKTQSEISDVVDALATRSKFHSHGSVVDHAEAARLGLAITYLPPEDDLWKRIWLLYCMYDHDAKSSSMLKFFESCTRSLAIALPSAAPAPG